jgi:hypothetical protein
MSMCSVLPQKSAIPSTAGGLHCSWTNLGKGQPETLVLPPLIGGLHCGDGQQQVIQA